MASTNTAYRASIQALEAKQQVERLKAALAEQSVEIRKTAKLVDRLAAQNKARSGR